jgi:DNA-binding response OmpR family regulator
MVDVQADAASKAGTSPQDERRGAFAFAGLALDLDAWTLKRESGEAITLTRGEFALLREFVRRPGRVLSRDLLLDAAVGRRNVPFHRSVDVMVGRLRKKVEPALSCELILVVRRLESPVRTQATVAARHVRMASSRKTPSVRRDVRWRWTLKVFWTAA